MFFNNASGSLFPVDLVGHDVVEVISHNETIVVEVSLFEHVVDLFFGKVLAQVLSDLLELQSGDLALSNKNITALLTSNEAQTLSISARLSLSLILAVASLKNSGNSIPPDWSSSSSAKIW